MGHEFFPRPKVMNEFIWWATACQEFFNIKNRTWRIHSTRSIFSPGLRFHGFFSSAFSCAGIVFSSTTTFPPSKNNGPLYKLRKIKHANLSDYQELNLNFT